MKFGNVVGFFLLLLGIGVMSLTYAYSFAENSVNRSFPTDPQVQGQVASLFNQSFAITYAVGGASIVLGIAILCLVNRASIYSDLSRW